MKDKFSLVVSLIAVVIAVGAYLFPAQDIAAGALYRNPNSDFQAKSLTAGNLNGSVGCVGVYGTSAATANKLVFTTVGATSTQAGTVYWTYGTCP